MGVRPGVPEAGPPTIRWQGGAGLSLLDLGVSRGGTPKVPEKVGRVGLDITRLRQKDTSNAISVNEHFFPCPYTYVIEKRENKIETLNK